MFDGFFTRIRTIMGLGASHGKRGFPREEHGIAIHVWGVVQEANIQQNKTADQHTDAADANVTPIGIVGSKSNG